jgi:hypothetical protein
MADDNLFKQVGDVQEFAKNGNVKLLRFNTKNNLEYLTTTTKPHVDNIIKAVIEHYGLSSKTKIHININLYKFNEEKKRYNTIPAPTSFRALTVEDFLGKGGFKFEGYGENYDGQSVNLKAKLKYFSIVVVT